MSDSMFHYMEITIQVLMFCSFLFGGARWIGETTQMLKRLTSDFDKHSNQDQEQFRNMETRMTSIQVSLAKQGVETRIAP